MKRRGRDLQGVSNLAQARGRWFRGCHQHLLCVFVCLCVCVRERERERKRERERERERERDTQTRPNSSRVAQQDESLVTRHLREGGECVSHSTSDGGGQGEREGWREGEGEGEGQRERERGRGREEVEGDVARGRVAQEGEPFGACV